MQPKTFIAHVEVLATSVVGAAFAAATTLVGQGVPDPKTQGTVALLFGAFVYLAALVHRWKDSPAAVEADFGGLLKQLLPTLAGTLTGLAGLGAPCPDCAKRAAASSGSANPPAGKP